jgi:protein-S-isoprenylcysteine O-methyltransferase Ste14
VSNPDLSGTDVEQAFGVARRALGGGLAAPRAILVALGLAVALVAGLAFFSRGAGFPVPWILVAIGLLAVAAAAAASMRR